MTAAERIQDKIQKLRALHEKATPAPWTHHGPSRPGRIHDDGGDYRIGAEGAPILAEAYRRLGTTVIAPAAENAALMSAMRNALPALLDVVECAACVDGATTIAFRKIAEEALATALQHLGEPDA